MSAFAIISTGKNPPLSAAVTRVYPDNYAISELAWLIADQGVTTQEVCRKLGIGEDGVRDAVVIKVDSYWGLAPKTIWEWLSVKASGP